jgi:hypothetical protein
VTVIDYAAGHFHFMVRSANIVAKFENVDVIFDLVIYSVISSDLSSAPLCIIANTDSIHSRYVNDTRLGCRAFNQLVGWTNIKNRA